MKAVFIKSAAQLRDFPPDEGAEVAVVGRSNSGKSSAINTITGHQGLARVSKTPGRTQLINFFSLGGTDRLVDLPGYGFARVAPAVRDRWQHMMNMYFESRQTLRGLLITVDIRRGVLELDHQMLAYARDLDLATTLLATKSDKLSRSAGLTAARQMEAATSTEVIRFSSLDRTGIEDARAQITGWLTPT